MRDTIPMVESASIEPLKATLEFSSDPTGSAPEFAIGAVDATSPSGGWAAGSWISTWAQKTGWTTALTATVGPTGADLETAEGGRYKMWIRYQSGRIKLLGIFGVR